MNTHSRLTLAAVTACTFAAVLSGCATIAAVPSPSASTSAAVDASVTPTPTTISDQAPKPVPTSSVSASSGSASSDSARSPLAQHIYEACSTGAAAAGVTLTFTENPPRYPATDGKYELIYPFTFNDGHSDPYAIFDCVLTDSTLRSSYVSGGLSDSH